MSTAAVAAEALRLEGVHKAFGSFIALKSIDLTCRRASWCASSARRGAARRRCCGSSPGWRQQTDGRILQGGRDVSRAPPAARDYGIVFQSYALFPNLTIAENVAYGLVNRRKSRAQHRGARRGTADAGRPARRRREVSRARCRAASSSASRSRARWRHRPACCCSTSRCRRSMRKVRERLRGEIRSAAAALGVTTIMVTHDQEEALSMADRVVVMNQGVIEQVGRRATSTSDPATPFVADFLGKVNVLKRRRAGRGRYRVGASRTSPAGRTITATAQRCAHLSAPRRPRMSKAIVAGDCRTVCADGSPRSSILGTFCLAELALRSAGPADADFVLAQSAARPRRARRRVRSTSRFA